MGYREATYEDRLAIADLHAESWRFAYRGAYRDDFLDRDVWRDRIGVWEVRLAAPPENQHVIVGEEEGQLIGFACAYGGDDRRWGTLLDNLHVRPALHRRGAGTRLVREVGRWCRARYPDCGLYLWVLEQNARARSFYERMGAADRGGGIFVAPGGGEIRSRRYAWANLDEIAHAGRE